MLGYETRNLAIEERNAIGIRRLEHNAMVRFRRKTGARAAGSADAAYRCGMRQVRRTVGGIMMVAVAVLVRMFFCDRGTPVVRLAERR